MGAESARKKGRDLGTRAESRGRREQVAACLSAQLFCVREPERDRSSWEENKQLGQGPSWSFAAATGSETKAKPPESDSWECSLPPPTRGVRAPVPVSARQTAGQCPPGRGARLLQVRQPHGVSTGATRVLLGPSPVLPPVGWHRPQGPNHLAPSLGVSPDQTHKNHSW